MRRAFLGVALLSLIACGGAAALDIRAQPKTSFSNDQSDLWWNPAESGWGMQIVQQADVLFATLFVYDAAGAPTFFTATLMPTSTLAWSGDLYRTTGPYFGAPAFDAGFAGAVVARKVGVLTFSRPTSDVASVQYGVDGVLVNKTLQRQLLRYDDYSGNYVATVNMIGAHCPATADNGSATAQYAITIAHNAMLMSMRWVAPDGTTCDYGGSFFQQGHVGQLAASYTCSTGERGNMAFAELTNRVGMIAGHFQGHSDSTGCDRSGRFTGLTPN